MFLWRWLRRSYCYSSRPGPRAPRTSTSVQPPTRITAIAAGELGQALLQLLAVVVRGGLLDLRLDPRASGPGHLVLRAGAVDRSWCSPSRSSPAWRGPACPGRRSPSLMPRSSLIDLALGQNRDVLEHRLAPLARSPAPLTAAIFRPPRSLVEPPASPKNLALDVLRHDQAAGARPRERSTWWMRPTSTPSCWCAAARSCGIDLVGPPRAEPDLAGQGRGRVHDRPLRGRLGRRERVALPAGEAVLGLEPRRSTRPARRYVSVDVPPGRLRRLPGAAPVHARPSTRPGT